VRPWEQDDTLDEDEDVATERQRVHDMAASGFSTERAAGARDTRDGVILDNITKTFGAGKNKKKVGMITHYPPRHQHALWAPEE